MDPLIPSISLRQFHTMDGRCIHYSIACLRQDPTASIGATFLDDDTISNNNIRSSWVFFYPVGPNRRLLQLILTRYAPKFHIDNGDVLFLCLNRPGKCGTSKNNNNNSSSTSPDKQHIQTASHDILTIMDHYQISQTSLLYMCAGSTFAYSFAATFPHRTTGHIIGISSWIVRDNAPTIHSPCGASHTADDTDYLEQSALVPQRPVHSWLHRMAMSGMLGPKWWVAFLAGCLTGNARSMLGVVPDEWVRHRLRNTLSEWEKREFDRDGGGRLVEWLKWMYQDGWENEGESNNQGEVPLSHNHVSGKQHSVGGGDYEDISVCLSTQEELGLMYATSIPTQKQVLLWHGTNDHMISLAGSAYLASCLPHSELNVVENGTHQGTMLFFPEGVMDALNSISRTVQQ